MKNKFKKIISILIVLVFVFTIAETSMSKMINNEDIDKKNIISHTVQLSRHGLDGSITEIEVKIKISEDQDLSKAIQKKCEELFKNDIEFRNYLSSMTDENNTENNTNSSNGSGLFFVLSRGKGIHMQTKMFAKLLFKLILNKLKLPSFFIKLRKKIVFCLYRNNFAFTYVNPIINLNGSTNSTFVNGAHSLSMIGFKGYTGWCKRIKLSTVFARSLCGFCNYYSLSQ